MKNLLTITCILLISIKPFSQELERRVFLGIRMENIDQGRRQMLDLKNTNGVLISEILPASTALEAGFLKGDILLSLDNKQVSKTTDVLDVLIGKFAGQSFQYELLRDKKFIKGKAILKGFPEEKYADLEVIYSTAKTQLGLERIIITKPKSNIKLPVIAFIGGIGCYSLDFPMDSTRSEVQLLNMLSRNGYLCARLEKPGIGDNAKTSKACNEVSFMEETSGYIDAINTLKRRPDVDSNSVYIIGHSMGGVFGPLVAQKTKVKGIIAYGTIGSNFQEYLAKTRRTIAEAYNMNPEETDDLIKNFCECSGYYFADKMTTAEVINKKPECQEYLSVFDLRARTYNDQLYDFNIPGLWKYFDGKALLMWGESDYISSREDHQIIEKAVNYYHPGNAEFITVNKADHGMRTASGFSEARQNPGPYNSNVGNTMLSWLRKQSRV